jgi:hypothetical protein
VPRLTSVFPHGFNNNNNNNRQETKYYFCSKLYSWLQTFSVGEINTGPSCLFDSRDEMMSSQM